MSKFIFIAVSIVVLVLVCGGVVLAFWPLSAPSTKVEKVLPDARFPK